MPRRLTLSDEQVEQLQTRITIARALGLFTLRVLTDHWTISKATLYRYSESKYRELSRENARNTYQEQRAQLEELKDQCLSCKQSLEGHTRCLDCTCLMHNDNILCGSCIDTRRRKILRGLDIVDVTDIFTPLT